MTHLHNTDSSANGHALSNALPLSGKVILQRGLQRLVESSAGLQFRAAGSDRYPLPLAMAVYGSVPQPERVRRDLAAGLAADPVSVLEQALVLLELIECNNPPTVAAVPDDDIFLAECFKSKRLNGWIATLGNGDATELTAAINAHWKFKFVSGGGPWGSLYVLLNMLARYGFVYGRIEAGDSHALGHFIEEFTPGLLICRGAANDADLALSLAGMKLGVPAIVPTAYPFPLGRMVRVETLPDIVASVVVFPNIRRLLDTPGIPPLPDDLDPENARASFVTAACWGDTPDSFCLLRKGEVANSGEVTVVGQPSGPMGIVLTAEGEPLDAFDCRYIETRACAALSMRRGMRARPEDGKLRLDLAAGMTPDPQQIGRTLIAAIRHEFPRLQKVRAELIFDRERLSVMSTTVQTELETRRREIRETTEESMATFVTCVGCSPFAPDHACILTPDRPPQCGRPYEMIKAGALYNYDDMTDIHHRGIHTAMNSFGTCPKGNPVAAASGEWSGVNEAVSRLTGGRTRRVQLHSLAEAPHTGCGCFRLILFRLETPRPGIGIMDRTFKGTAPDGRTWQALHYALGGKQAAGLAGATMAYLKLAKFLAGDGGWKKVLWVSPKIAEFMGTALPAGIETGRDVV